MKWCMNTEVDIVNKAIYQKLETDVNGTVTTISRWVIDTREESIRKALIELGWASPEE